MRQVRPYVLCCLLLVLSGCAWLDRITGADGKSGGPGQPKTALSIATDAVGAVPIYGGIIASILGIFGTAYNGIRAKKLGTQAAVAQQTADDKGAKLLAVIDGAEAAKDEIAAIFEKFKTIEEVKAFIASGGIGTALTDVLREVAAAHNLYLKLKAEVNAFRATKA
jgi:hypothetical protein